MTDDHGIAWKDGMGHLKGAGGSVSNARGNRRPELKPESQLLLQQLVADANEHGLVLFIGSGINASAVPQWDNLLGKLLTQAIGGAAFEDHRVERYAAQLRDWCRSNYDVCAQASIVKRILGPERYRLEIQDALYEGRLDVEKDVKTYCNTRRKGTAKARRDFEFLRVVADICSLPQVRAVATFNFDTLLECAIDALKQRKPRAHFGQVAALDEGRLAESDLPIYHVHGLLSPPGTFLRNPAESVVLSYDEYFDKNADPLSWETSTSLHFIRNYCTLWLGVSLKDWNMLRLLDSAWSGRKGGRSYCIQCPQDIRLDSVSPGGRRRQELQEVALRFQATLFDAVGMRLIVVGSKFTHIPPTIAEYIIKPLAKKES